MAELVVYPAALFSRRYGRRGVPGEELDVETVTALDRRKQMGRPPIDQLGFELGKNCARLLEAPEHCERRGTMRTHEEGALLARILLVLPGEQLGERRGAVEASVADPAEQSRRASLSGVRLGPLIRVRNLVHLRSHVRDLPA